MPRSLYPSAGSALGILWFVIGGCTTPTAPTGDSPPDDPTDDPTDLPADLPTDQADESALVPRFDPDGEDFYRMPWPSDHRVLADGTVDFSDFPQASSGLIQLYRDAVEGTVRGFSTMPVGYFEFNIHAGAASLPTAETSLTASSSVQLMEISADGCGTRIPVEVQMNTEADTHINANVLQIAPVPGFVLKQATTYAFLVLRSFGAEGGMSTARPAVFEEALQATAQEEAGDALAESLSSMVECLRNTDVPLGNVAVATVFTTQDVLGEARAIRDAVADPDYIDAPVIEDWELNANYTESGDYTSYNATFSTPIFQDGETPYTQTGGNIHFDEDGRPIVQRWEDVPMLITVPADTSGPFPVLFFMDGTGWSRWTHVRDNWIQDALDAGFAIASYMPQFHGGRSGPDADETTHTYNFFNPVAGRNNFRQQLADSSYFIRVLREAITGDLVELDTTRIVFGGQSQGAQNGAHLAAVEPEIQAFALNGLAAYLSVTIVERKDIEDFEALVRTLFGIGGELDRFYPLLQMAQVGADSVETHNFAIGWRGSELLPSGSNVFVINGYLDDTTHPVGMNALTIAGDLAVLDPAGWDVDPFGVWSRTSEALPLSGNRTATDGTAITLATYLSATEGHSTVYQDATAREMSVNFWSTALSATPSLVQ